MTDAPKICMLALLALAAALPSAPQAAAPRNSGEARAADGMAAPPRLQLADWQKTKKDIKHSSKKAGRDIGKGATEFGKGVAKGAKTVGKETRRVGRSIKKGVKDLFK